MPVHRRIVIILAIALLALPAWAATLQRLDFDEMIEKSTAIVRGQVVASSARFHGPVIYTHYRLRVLEQIKGAEAAEVDVVVPGGVANGLRQAFAGAPKLQAGSEYVLFLWTGASGLTTIIGFSQGLFDVHRDIAGGAFAARMATSEAMLDNLGRLVRDEPLRIRFEELRSRVRAAAARGVVR